MPVAMHAGAENLPRLAYDRLALVHRYVCTLGNTVAKNLKKEIHAAY